MRTYTKPAAQVVELSVKESIALKTKTKNFGFGANDGPAKNFTLITYADTELSLADDEEVE